MGGACGTERFIFWWVGGILVVMLEANSKKLVRLCQTSRILLEGGEEGMGFRIPSTGFSVKPNVQAYASLQSSFVYKIFSGHLCSHVGYCSTCFFFFPSAVASPSLFISYNVFICFPLSWNLLSSLKALAILFTVDFNHFFYSITMCLMRFGVGRGVIVYALSTASRPLTLWNVLEGDQDSEETKWSILWYTSARLNLLLLFMQVLFSQKK